MELIRLLAEAERWLGRLDRGASDFRNADLFVAMYLHKEALHSSEIEGTQSTLEEVLQFEVEGNTRRRFSADVREVANYVEALKYGLERLEDIPLSKRLIRQIHAQLLKGRAAEVTALALFVVGRIGLAPTEPLCIPLPLYPRRYPTCTKRSMILRSSCTIRLCPT